MTNRIRSGLAISLRKRRLAFTNRPASSWMSALSFAVVLAAAGLGLASGGRLPANAGSFAQAAPAGATNSESKVTPSAIQIEPVEYGDVKLPPEFRVAVYEYLLAAVSKSGKFQHVYRSGDRAATAAPDLVIVHMKVRGFKQGSQRTREVTTVVGATSVTLGVQVTRRDGSVLVERDVEGRVRFFGTNLRATLDFSKKVAKLLRESL
jgi:hypothetical protein